jgi:TatD DNase family protein
LTYIDIHTHSAKVSGGIKILNIFPEEEALDNTYFSCGIHPWYISDNYKTQIEKLSNKLLHPNILAIGECGIDKIKGPDISLQKQVFIAQLILSKKYNLPLIIHCVRAFDEILELLNTHNITQPVIFHGYNNKLNTAQKIIKNNYFISLGKHLLIEDSNAQQVLKNIPVNHIFFETDDADISIETIYQKSAQILNIDVESLKENIFLRFTNNFNLK